MNLIYTLFGVPLGFIMWACYRLTHHYVLSLFLFTLITRLILIPFTIKQQKSTVKMAMIKPQLDELQKKYANNREKLNEEMMKLYQKEGYNPTAGCLPLLIQMPILFGLIDVIYKPLKHILRLPAEVIQSGVDIVQSSLTSSRQSMMVELAVIKEVKIDPQRFAVMGQEAIDAIQNLNLNFLGMDLTLTPTVEMFKNIFTGSYNGLIFIPIFAGLTSLLMSYVTMKNSMGTTEGAAAASMKSMMFTMPILSTVISFSVPAGVGIYWSFSNIVALVQTMIMNKFYNPKEMAEKAKAEMEERREKERLERIEAKKLKQQGLLDVEEKSLSQKEMNRRKLAEARKREAEKYGEEYVEVKDDDEK